MLDTLTVNDWSACLGQIFQIHSRPEEQLDLQLTSVTPLGAEGGYRRQPYSLLFSGPLTPLLPQAIYPLRNAVLGELGIFLVPLGPAGQTMRYEAIFT